MSTLNVPRRALPTQGDTIADAIGQVAQTFADAQLRQEAIDATQRANQARIEFEDRSLAQRASLAMAAEDAGILAAKVRVKAEKAAATEVQAAAQKRKETPTPEAPPKALERAGQLADILKAGVDTFSQQTIDAINAQIQLELKPSVEEEIPAEAEPGVIPDTTGAEQPNPLDLDLAGFDISVPGPSRESGLLPVIQAGAPGPRVIR